MRRWLDGRAAHLLWNVLLIASVFRLVVASASGLERNRGDFYATLPGAYAETLNPALWNSPDLELADGFQRAEYLYGPTQYLTIFPLVFLDSYESVATLLLFLYLPLIGLSAYMMWRSFRLFNGAPAYGGIAIFVSTSMFLPVLQAYGQREFEVVILFLATCALYALLTKREGIAGALLGYATWFKFFPLAFLPYFIIRRWSAAVACFVAVSVLTLGVTELSLGLARFRPVVDLARTEARAGLVTQGFCEAWARPETRNVAIANSTRASIKWALCSLQDRWSWLSARVAHSFGAGLIVAACAFGYWRLRRRSPLGTNDERWRRSLEVGIVLTAPWLFWHAHYYYLIFAIVPLNALLIRYLGAIEAGGSWKPMAAWMAAYLMLGAFLVPPSVLSQLLGSDVWRLYMRSTVYFFGEVLLLALLVWEYVMLERHCNRGLGNEAAFER